MDKVVYCRSKTEYDTLMKYIEYKGGRWTTGFNPTAHNDYYQDIVINVTDIKKMLHSSKACAEMKGFTILSLCEYTGIGEINKNNAGNSIKTFMTNFKSIIKELTRTEPEKTFIEAGFMDSDENLTVTGREALESILIKAHATELLALATQVKAYNDSKKA